MFAGERVMAWLKRLYGELKLQINEAKSAVCSAFGRQFLGYELWMAKAQEVKCAVADKALGNFKSRADALLAIQNPPDPFAERPEIGAQLREALSAPAG